MEEIMQKISNFLDCKLSTRIFKLNQKEFDSFTITTSNKNSNQILLGIEIILFYLSLIVLLTLSIILCTK